MKVVVEGCCHGELDRIYDVISQLEEREGIRVDLLICCGDFQAVRDKDDLQSMAVPPKYREMGSFFKYYTGEKVAPVLTIFIGGNHEASNHLWELSHGGWVASNIYYIGRAGVVSYGGLRIAGLSGIYKDGDYRKCIYECPPFTEATKRSIYHVRSFDVFRLKQLSGNVDIGLSHDWPLGIYHHGNKAQLLRKKPYFAEEIENETLGSPAAMELLRHMKPDFWFSAHLHVKFAAVYRHDDDTTGRITKFLALDKCLPGRRYLQVLDIPSSSPPPHKLTYDLEWLAIIRNTQSLMATKSRSLWLPPHPSTDSRVEYTPTVEELEEVNKLLHGDLVIPDNSNSSSTSQTAAFCATLGICTSNVDSTTRISFGSRGNSLYGNYSTNNPDEIDIEDSEEEEPSCHGDSSIKTSDKRRYPWLNKQSSDDEESTHYPESSMATSVTTMGDTLDTASDSELQKSLLTTADSQNPDEILLGDEEEGEEEKEEEETEEPRARPTVVIKRRNASMYTPQEEDT